MRTVVAPAQPWPTTVFSPCRTWRYILYRPETLLRVGPPLLANLINPSTADEFENDPTTHLMMRWCEMNGFGDYLATNPHAICGSKPHVIDEAEDPVGPDNDEWIRRAVRWVREAGGTVVVGWGDRRASGREERMIELLGRPLYCFGFTRSGSPHFPTPFLMRTNPPLQQFVP